MTFAHQDNRRLFITENSDTPVCISIRVPEEEIEKEEGFDNEDEEEEE